MITTINEFKKINENWYHGSEYKFSSFKTHNLTGPSALGIFVTDDKSLAELFGNNIYDVNIITKNPKKISMDKWDNIREKHANDTAYFKKMREELISNGFDSLFIKERSWKSTSGTTLRDGNIVVLFNPNQLIINELININESFNKTIYYHGTKHKFDSFKLNNDISNDTYNLNEFDNNLGIFFTDNLIMAKSFADLIEFDPNSGKYVDTNNEGYIINAELNINNPWILQEQVKDIDIDDAGQTYFNIIEEYGGGLKFREYLISKGYDAVIVKDVTTNYYENGNYKIIIVFNTTQIKIIK